MPIKYAVANQKHNKAKINQEQYRTMPLYMVLLCGVILMLVGVWLSIFNISANGKVIGNRYGEGPARNVVLNGPETIVIGIAICIFPAIQLMKRRKGKNETEE